MGYGYNTAGVLVRKCTCFTPPTTTQLSINKNLHFSIPSVTYFHEQTCHIALFVSIINTFYSPLLELIRDSLHGELLYKTRVTKT